MGIDGFHDYVRKNIPGCIKTLPISSLNGLKIAIDAPGYLYKFGSGVNAKQSDRLRRMVNLYVFLRAQGAKCYFVFDGQPPPEKSECLKGRKEKKEKAKEDIANLKRSLVEYENQKKIWINESDLLHGKPYKPLFVTSLIEKEIFHCYFDSNFLIDKVLSLEKKTKEMNSKLNSLLSGPAQISEKEKEEIKSALFQLGANVINAKEDGEATCALLNRIGLVDAAVTEDGDFVPYGGKIMILLQDMNVNCSEFRCYNVAEIIKGIGITLDQFSDVCAISGCDFSNGVKSLGFKKALGIIKEHGNIENYKKLLGDKNSKIQRKEELKQLFEKLDYLPARNVYKRWRDKYELPLTPPVEKNDEVFEYVGKVQLLKWEEDLTMIDLIEALAEEEDDYSEEEIRKKFLSNFPFVEDESVFCSLPFSPEEDSEELTQDLNTIEDDLTQDINNEESNECCEEIISISSEKISDEENITDVDEPEDIKTPKKKIAPFNLDKYKIPEKKAEISEKKKRQTKLDDKFIETGGWIKKIRKL